MMRRSRSDVAWAPAKARSRLPLLLAALAVVAVALVGYFNVFTAGAPHGDATSSDALPPSAGSKSAPARRPPRQRAAGSLASSTAPRVSPAPRKGIGPRRAPLARGELREASGD